MTRRRDYIPPIIRDDLDKETVMAIAEIARLRAALHDIDVLCDRALREPKGPKSAKSHSSRRDMVWIPAITAVRTIKNVIEELASHESTRLG